MVNKSLKQINFVVTMLKCKSLNGPIRFEAGILGTNNSRACDISIEQVSGQ